MGGSEHSTRIALVGLPNSGKSRLFNSLSGEYALVANYPLTTVEIQRGATTIRSRRFEIADTPGLHGLYIHSEEEIVVRDYLYAERPDGLILCVDANRLKQSLLLFIDLAELGIPMVVSLNSVDETSAKGLVIDTNRLSEALGVPVVEHLGPEGTGVEAFRSALSELVETIDDGIRPTESTLVEYGGDLEALRVEIEGFLPSESRFSRKTAMLMLENDPHIAGLLRWSDQSVEAEGLLSAADETRRKFKGNISTAIAQARSKWVEEILDRVASRRPTRLGHFAEVFSRLSRHPVFGLPILACFLAFTYFMVVIVAGHIEGFLSGLIVDPLVGLIDGAITSPFWKGFLIGDFGVLTIGLFNAFVTVLPILSMYFLVMGLMEDIGYLPNLSVLTRRLLEKIGLSGHSVMSLVLSFGCKTMATLTTKAISSKRERFIAIYLIAFAIPCSAQFAIDMGILGRVGLGAFLIAYFYLGAVELLAGYVLNKVKKSEAKTEFIQQLPPIRMPSPTAILKKTYYRIRWFLKEAVPVFVIAAVLVFAVDAIGVLGLLQNWLRPIVVGWLGLPVGIVEILIVSLARHEAAAGMLMNLVDSGALSYVQSIVAVVITTMFVPCFANIVAMCKHVGVVTGILMALAINISSFLLAGVLNLVLVSLNIGGA